MLQALVRHRLQRSLDDRDRQGSRDADRQRPQLLALELQALVRYFSCGAVHPGIGDPL